MAWMRPSLSRPGQGMDVEGKSGGAGGSSLPGGGPAAVGDGCKGVMQRRGAETPLHQFHHWPSIVTPPAGLFADPAVSALPIRIAHRRLSQQRQKELEPGSVGGSGVELDSSGKQCCLIKVHKAFSMAFSRLSCTVWSSLRKSDLKLRHSLQAVRIASHI
jgi:hypothetical protein